MSKVTEMRWDVEERGPWEGQLTRVLEDEQFIGGRTGQQGWYTHGLKCPGPDKQGWGRQGEGLPPRRFDGSWDEAAAMVPKGVKVTTQNMAKTSCPRTFSMPPLPGAGPPGNRMMTSVPHSTICNLSTSSAASTPESPLHLPCTTWSEPSSHLPGPHSLSLLEGVPASPGAPSKFSST